MKVEKNLIGAAGEHIVLSRLLARGILAAQSPFNAFKADILINPSDGGRPYLIQVKTRLSYEKKLRGWLLSEKNETQSDGNFFYCFVDLGLVDSKVYVVPSKKVAAILVESHQRWISTPGKKGQARNESSMRKLRLDYSNTPLKSAKGLWMEKYLENWDFFNSDAG
jgi:hypothetical protein